jgi:hypothetical protein
VAAALNWQLGFYKLLDDNRERLGLGKAQRDKFVIGAMANWMFRFGDYGPKIFEDPSLKPAVESAFQRIKSVLADEDLVVELTLAAIVAAAAQDVPIWIFKSHFDTLHKLGLVMKGINIYGAEERLVEEHRPFYYYMQYGETS